MGQNDTKSEQNKIKKKRTDSVAVLWFVARCVAAEAVGLDCFTDRRCSAAAWRTDRPTVQAPRPTSLGQRDEQPRVSFGASGTCWPQLGGASGMLHRTVVVMAPRRGSCDGSDAAARNAAGSKQRPQWTMSSTNMRLSDFLTMELDGRDALDANRDVLPEGFLKDPKKYIRDKGVLKEIQASDRYKRMERAVRDEMDMEEYVNSL
ncbi:putative retrotransposon hot spot protein (RHS,) [Trypanosoma cruzi]|uniref:Putative retrotransposon hot spot protein (RHS,) n=1 Tax=Trypanosoma cruzi TaxID=5693 RepID=A0A2V2VPE8_TRYCR|nr:putative retrotransposon hot spot protein (RHS,) [Trypanosoma cruzi]